MWGRSRWAAAVMVIAALLLPAARTAAGTVDDARLVAADKDTANWLSYGRTYDEQRFSPLAAINDGNAARLGLAWSADLATSRGQEATPLVIDGVMYVAEAWSVVEAFDARTGKRLWIFDPKVPRATLIKACCDAVNRGVAAWSGKIYVATLDGRLIALDAATGASVWSIVTVDQQKPYTITGAPRIAGGRVLIGNAGGELGMRGYLSAYDAETGKLDWRFYTVPGDPAKPVESKALARAAKTWHGKWWRLGGGGPVWDAISYDPDLGLVYFGVGNGTEFPRKLRSPGGGDNLFLSSIVAVKAATGEFVWHYQTTPGDEWDYDATQQLLLADLAIEGRTRKVLMQANKNGFFYVLDRTDGALVSATPFVAVNWTTGIDPRTGRPVENKAIRYDESGKPVLLQPGALGAHSWNAMSFDPLTGLVYFPAQESAFPYAEDPKFKAQAQGFNIALDLSGAGPAPSLPGDAKPLTPPGGLLLAWDPVARKAAWRVRYPGGGNGGTLSTAGNLVVQGTVAGEIRVLRASDGQPLWSMPAETAVIAPPIAYSVDGEQYIAVLAGWGGALAMLGGQDTARTAAERNVSRVLVLKLGGGATLPPAPPLVAAKPTPLAQTADAAMVAQGAQLYARNCVTCHGIAAVGGGVNPDLRFSALLDSDQWFDVVLGGAFQDEGMVSFAPILSRAQAAAIRAWVVDRANAAAE